VEVVDYVERGWFLLREGEHHYLTVNCHLPLADVSITLRLSPEEEAELHALGHVFAAYFAAKIAYWTDRYWPRNLNGAISTQITDAIVTWRAGGGAS